MRCIACLALLSVIYGIIFILPQRQAEKRDEPIRHLASLRAAVEQNRLLLASYRQIDGNNVAATEALETLSADLAENRQLIGELTEKHFNLLDPVTTDMLNELLNLEKQLMDQYQARFTALSKLVTYNPTEELKPEDSSDLIQRANDTSRALSNFANMQEYAPVIDNIEYRFSLPQNTRATIADSARCFNNYATHLESGDVVASERDKVFCSSNYAKTRGSVIVTITSVFVSETGQKAYQSAEDIASILSAKITDLDRI